MKRQHLLTVLQHLLPCILPGYTIKRNHAPSGLASTIDFVAAVRSENLTLKKILVQGSDSLSSEIIQTHAILKHELTQAGLFSGKDEYWLAVTEEPTPELKQGAESKYIKLLGTAWLQENVSKNINSSRKLREAVQTLESIGISIGP